MTLLQRRIRVDRTREQRQGCAGRFTRELHPLLRSRRAEQGLALPEIGPSPGIEALEWPRPVYPGDTVTYSGEVLSKRLLASRPRWGLVSSRIVGVNQDGAKVLSLVSKLMVERRASGHARSVEPDLPLGQPARLPRAHALVRVVRRIPHGYVERRGR